MYSDASSPTTRLRPAATISGRKLDGDQRSSMPIDGVQFAAGGVVTGTSPLGVMSERRYTGTEAAQALELNRPPVSDTPPRPRTLEERLRALGVRV